MKATLRWSRGLRLAVSGVAVLVLAADQVSKSLVVAADPGGSVGGIVSVRLVRNTGASFGIGSGHPLVITLTAAVVLAVALVLLARARSRALALSLAAVAGGAAGNLADRLLRGPGLGRGAVVDWIHVVGYPATFNVADVAIRLGAVCAVIAVLVGAPRQAEPGDTRPRLAGTVRLLRSRPWAAGRGQANEVKDALRIG
jgi:signal peptidase II